MCNTDKQTPTTPLHNKRENKKKMPKPKQTRKPKKPTKKPRKPKKPRKRVKKPTKKPTKKLRKPRKPRKRVKKPTKKPTRKPRKPMKKPTRKPRKPRKPAKRPVKKKPTKKPTRKPRKPRKPVKKPVKKKPTRKPRKPVRQAPPSAVPPVLSNQHKKDLQELTTYTKTFHRTPKEHAALDKKLLAKAKKKIPLQFTKLTDKQLDWLFRCIDDVYFGKRISKAICFGKKSSVQMKFSASVPEHNPNTAGVCSRVSRGGVICRFVITLSPKIFLDVFKEKQKQGAYVSNGKLCRSRLECALNVLCHEMIHLVFYLTRLGMSHDLVFQDTVRRFFYHTKYKHAVSPGRVVGKQGTLVGIPTPAILRPGQRVYWSQRPVVVKKLVGKKDVRVKDAFGSRVLDRRDIKHMQYP